MHETTTRRRSAARRRFAAFGAILVVLGTVTTAVGVGEIVTPALPAAADNGYGPGTGPQAPTQHWGGAYVLTGVPGYAYCIFPGSASPAELPTTPWNPIAYPGSGVFSDGQMAALAYFAERYQGTGWNGYSVDTTVAAIAQIAYTSAGGTTPPGSRAPAALVAAITAWITTYAGPWTVSLTMTPPSGSTFTANRNYSGTVTVRSATGAGVGGLQLTPPPTGGPGANQISNFGWLAATTNAAGQLSFVWNIDAVPPGGIFSAQGMNVVGDAPGTAPPAYGAPGGSGGQLMMVSGASELLGTGFGGVTSSSTVLTGTISIAKAVNDPAYYGPGGAVFQIRDGFGNVLDTLVTDGSGDAGPSITLTATTTGTQYAVVEVTAAARLPARAADGRHHPPAHDNGRQLHRYRTPSWPSRPRSARRRSTPQPATRWPARSSTSATTAPTTASTTKTSGAARRRVPGPASPRRRTRPAAGCPAGTR